MLKIKCCFNGIVPRNKTKEKNKESGDLISRERKESKQRSKTDPIRYTRLTIEKGIAEWGKREM